MTQLKCEQDAPIKFFKLFVKSDWCVKKWKVVCISQSRPHTEANKDILYSIYDLFSLLKISLLFCMHKKIIKSEVYKNGLVKKKYMCYMHLCMSVCTHAYLHTFICLHLCECLGKMYVYGH